MKKKTKKQPWKNICSPQCWTATGDDCKCKCDGEHHGGSWNISKPHTPPKLK